MSAAPRHKHQQLNHKSSRFCITMHKTCANEPWRSFQGKPSSSKCLLLTLSHPSSLQTHFFAGIKIRVGRQSKITRNQLRRFEQKKGGQDMGHKPQHRKFPMNLGGIFSICLVLFIGSLSSWAVHVSEPTKGKCQGFRWAQHVSVWIFGSCDECHTVAAASGSQWDQASSFQDLTPFCAPQVILVEWQSSLFYYSYCLHRQHKL